MQRLYYNHEVAGGCPAAVGQFAVSANGDMYPCTSFLGIDKFKFGNVLSGLDKGKYKTFISSMNKRFTQCQECDLFSLCRTTGSCLNINYYFNGDPSIPYQKSCDQFREKLKLAIATLSILSDKIPDRLEELFNDGRQIWFTHSVIVDEDRMLDLIDQMRVSIPDEIKKAQKVLVERDRILAQAQEEASRTVTLAQNKSEQFVDREAVAQAASVKAEQILNQARLEADGVRREADDYVMDSLAKLEMELDRILTQVRNGIRTVQTEKEKFK